MGNYLYDDYEAKMKVTNDVINDLNFYNKLKENYVSPKKIFTFIQVIFCTFKCPPYHTKFVQLFYNNLNILERGKNFDIVVELYNDLTANHLTFHESYNNFNSKLNKILDDTPDRSIYNHSLVRPRKDAIDYFFLYVNFHINDFEQIKLQIKYIVKEVSKYPETIENDSSIQKVVTEEVSGNQRIEVTYIGHMLNGKREGKGMLVKKNKSNGQMISTYIGEFKEDKQNGLGLLKKPGEQMEGNFLDDLPDGKIGIYTDESKFYGQFEKGIKNGRSIELTKDGHILTQEYKNNEVFGPVSSYSKDGFFFTGKKINDEEIEGVQYSNIDGSVDVGIFDRNFELNGEGYKYRDNSSFYCTFLNGNIIPSIIYLCRDDGRISFGYCNERGKLNGKNILTFLYTNDEYKGDLKIEDYVNGEPMGKREYYWGDGDYEKIFENGWGFRVYSDNEKIMEGELEGGFAKGPGYFTYKGTRYSGVYKLNNVRCLFISNNNKAYSCGISHEARFNETTATQYKTQVNN